MDVAVMLAFSLVVLVWSVVDHELLADRRRRPYRALAASHGGELVEAPPGRGLPSSWLLFHGRRLEVSPLTPYRTGPLRVRLSVREANRRGVRCELHPETLAGKIAVLFGMQDVQLGVAGFDPRWILKTSDEPWLHGWLRAPVRDAAEALRSRSLRDEVHITLDRDWLTVVSRREVTSMSDLELLVFDSLPLLSSVLESLGGRLLPEAERGALEILAGSRLESGQLVLGTGARPPPPGARPSIHVADYRPPPAGAGMRLLPPTGGGTPVCQVCGQEVARPRATCRRCEAHHHPDCWEYNGVCSTFACGSTRWRRT